MTRIKKKRTSPKPIFLDVPRRSEKLADPDSYESRKRRSLEQKKKHKSVYEKAREAELAAESAEAKRDTPLADKIRRLKRAEEARQAEAEDK
ncbi:MULTISPECIES: hypothetical protein [Amphritea]|uniref:Uncharacterized protein n=2 Tax=Amphritea TaxID=515417 RepID=A0A1H9I443_9GAMM|nr:MULTISPECIES: hypothetical protein [Amphritea]MBN0987175.1 hypothetical protein [Amphritea pacifica]MBN1007819.1 hypothetical protein [Amphritea pacifica]SEQ69359.1 hypothetical protein SAMN03080615_02419 [Amphritea atlantica]